MSELEAVHETTEGIASIELTPPHPPRTETPIYRATHHRLVVLEDRPCCICGVRQSTLNTPQANPFSARALETHHFPVERSLLDACDWQKLQTRFPKITGPEHLEDVIDSEDNLLILCDVHHRHPDYGIHHLLTQDFWIQPYLKEGYRVAARAQDAAAALAADVKIEGS